jgi:pyruvate/2-oxoglutarate/acetoin dehydrogenase E1 component
MLHHSLQAAEHLAAEGISAGVIDLRGLSPLDLETIGASVRKTARVVIVGEGPKTGSVGAEIAASVMEECGEYLRCPIRRAASADVPVLFKGRADKTTAPDKHFRLHAYDGVQICGEGQGTWITNFRASNGLVPNDGQWHHVIIIALAATKPWLD